MKLINLLFLLFLIFIIELQAPASLADDGGSSSNGGGGELRDPTVLYSADDVYNYTEDLKRFKAKYPTAKFQSCLGSRLEIPAVPAPFAGLLKFELDFSQHSEVTTTYCLESNSRSSTFNTSRPFSITEICNSPPLAQSYGEFVKALYEVKEAPSAMDMILRTVDSGGKIPVVLTASKKTSEQNTILPSFFRNGPLEGTTSEFTWFEPGQGKIYWSPRSETNPIFMKRRPDSDFILHEIGHVFLFRSLGPKYPKERIWHDPKIAYLLDRMAANMDVATSDQAAFIEALANVMESEKERSHPYLELRDRNPLPVEIYRDQKTGKNVISYQGLSNWRRQGNTLDFRVEKEPPRNNENYVGSAIRMLLIDYASSAPGRSSLVQWIESPSRKRHLLDAIQKYHPANLRELALAFDQTDHSDLGSRWYRELFWRDPLSDRLILRTSDFGKSDFITEKPIHRRLFLSPVLEQRKTSAQNEAYIELGKGYPFDRFRDDVKKKAEEILELRQSAKNAMTLKSRVAIAQWATRYPVFCSDENSSVQERDQLIHSIYNRIQASKGTAALYSSLGMIDRNIQRGCKKSDRHKPDEIQQVWSQFEKANLEIQKLYELVNGLRDHHTQARYIKLLKKWDEIWSKADGPLTDLINFYTIAQIQPEGLDSR